MGPEGWAFPTATRGLQPPPCLFVVPGPPGTAQPWLLFSLPNFCSLRGLLEIHHLICWVFGVCVCGGGPSESVAVRDGGL